MACERPLLSGRVQQPKLTRENDASGDYKVLKQVAQDIRAILIKVYNHEGLLNQLVKNQPSPKAQMDASVYATLCIIVMILRLVVLALCMIEVFGKADYWRIYAPIWIGLFILSIFVQYMSNTKWEDVRSRFPYPIGICIMSSIAFAMIVPNSFG
ncbi:uncharacterized protein LOC122053546 isoform X1 [Zingiber officinale]|uniref:uncharacterized protein LOC122053546 isoform X1 n=1 Tax=Zingiber officinale TaxID=94328 RepID=UPI001C4BF9A5|nr:uncharacterized protein LOC122053546 isoform X1 [Zingiber officinale]